MYTVFSECQDKHEMSPLNAAKLENYMNIHYVVDEVQVNKQNVNYYYE